MCIERICDMLLRNPGLDVLALHLFDEFNSVFGDCQKRAHNASVLDRPSWSDEDDEIRHIGAAKAKVALRRILPFLSQIDTILANDWESGSVCYIEACSAYDSVDLPFSAIFPHYTFLRDELDGCEMHIYVVFLDGFHIRVSWRDATA
jgi:hypothetical protein